MARILVCEPHPEVQTLLAHVIARLGHEAVFVEESSDRGIDATVDVILIEPADPRALAAAQILRLQREDAPVICVSIYPPSSHSRRLAPVAYLLKPFALSDLERAVEAAVARLEVAA